MKNIELVGAGTKPLQKPYMDHCVEYGTFSKFPVETSLDAV